MTAATVIAKLIISYDVSYGCSNSVNPRPFLMAAAMYGFLGLMLRLQITPVNLNYEECKSNTATTPSRDVEVWWRLCRWKECFRD